MNHRALGIALAFVATLATHGEAQPVGSRPYEMDWAHRVQDTRPPLLDFESLADWTVVAEQAVASWTSSQEQRLWDQHVGKLVYRGTGPQPRVMLSPPHPVSLPHSFDCINLWVYGNNWAWIPDPTTPPVEIRVVLQNAVGDSVAVTLDHVRWTEWWLLHRRLTAEQIQMLGDRPTLSGIEIVGGRNTSDRTLYFDNLAVYQEPLTPLTFEPRARPGIQLPPAQTVGNNRGPGTLPFPTREQTILPDNRTAQYTTSVEEPTPGAFLWRYQGDDGTLTYRYRPQTGTLSDLSACWTDRGEAFQPCVTGGVYFWKDSGAEMEAPDEVTLVTCQQEGDQVQSVWRLSLGPRTALLTYGLRLWQKSLVLDIRCDGHEIGEFRIGKVVGVANPRLVTLPYLVGAEQRPALLVAGPVDQPLFISALMDHCRTNSSLFWFANQIADDGATLNGGTRYLPKTDGRRNSVFERLFVTVSPHFEETLPNIPNPRSPWMHVAGERLWRAHGASQRHRDYDFWKKVARYGMTKVVITDHETGWRDGGESFTMRTRAAPNKGGDEGQVDYAKKTRALGFTYGLYNNYTDFSPVNEYWDEDYVTRTPDNQWQPGWPRCYNLKPARAVELESRLAPVIQQKFQLDTAYCDVHTAVRPWAYCDFDARVPGAGAFAATFYAYGEIMLHQKATWNGPVYSEGNNHWYYCGLTDGNYGQDQAGQLATSPWLVDFDLLKMHPLCCNFGMGSPEMFYGPDYRKGARQDPDAWLDRFLAATLAFGHTGFLVFEGGFENAVRSYYSLQQIHARYAEQSAVSIRYSDDQGNLLESSAAIASDAYRRSQVATRYADGLETFVNGHATDNWVLSPITLPPNGWYVQGGESDAILAYSALVDGHRADYVDSRAYVYANGRGHLTRFPRATTRGQLVARRRDDDTFELFALGDATIQGIALDGQSASATALDEAGNPLQAPEIRFSRGIVYVMPVANAVSYILTPMPAPAASLTSDRTTVIPGETISLGTSGQTLTIPKDATPGSQIWHAADDAWIDFTVVPLVTTQLDRTDAGYLLQLNPLVPRATTATLAFADEVRELPLLPGETSQLTFATPVSESELVRELPLQITAGELQYRQTWWAKTEFATQTLGQPTEQFFAGERLRGGPERNVDGRSRALVHWVQQACGNESKKCLFVHPPYIGGVGYAFALLEAISLPPTPAAVFRCEIGKADGSDPGDGVLFQIAVVDDTGVETIVAERQWIEHAWTNLAADLSPWSGRAIRLKLICDAGPADNSSGDWGCWANLRIESRDPVLSTTIHNQPVALAREPGPFPASDLTRQSLRGLKRAVLHFRGIGLQHGGQYVTQGQLNDVALGPLPAAGGQEKEGKWTEAEISLPAAAIESLREWNELTLQNPGRDSFKVGHFWLALELADGRHVSSHVTNCVYTQPDDWTHAEGIGVPFHDNIRVVIRLPIR
ncbi:MAG: hypothetical protein ACYC0X_25790 [Pirellulaceae bacterium]